MVQMDTSDWALIGALVLMAAQVIAKLISDVIVKRTPSADSELEVEKTLRAELAAAGTREERQASRRRKAERERDRERAYRQALENSIEEEPLAATRKRIRARLTVQHPDSKDLKKRRYKHERMVSRGSQTANHNGRVLSYADRLANKHRRSYHGWDGQQEPPAKRRQRKLRPLPHPCGGGRGVVPSSCRWNTRRGATAGTS